MVALVSPLTANAQESPFAYSTGVDSSYWITLTSPTNVFSNYPLLPNDAASQVMDMGFSFMFGTATYTQFSVNSNGQMRLGSQDIARSPYQGHFWSYNVQSNMPHITGMGYDAVNYDTSCYIRYQTLGTAPNRVLVVEFMLKDRDYTMMLQPEVYYTYKFYTNWQVQLFETTNEVRLVYAELQPDALTYLTNYFGYLYNFHYQIGIAANSQDVIVVNPVTHDTTHGPSNNTYSMWPGAWRWYSFLPSNCTRPYDFVLSDVTDSSATLSWSDTSGATVWYVSWGEDPNNLNHFDSVTTPTANLTGLYPGTEVYYYVYGNGSCGSTAQFTCGCHICPGHANPATPPYDVRYTYLTETSRAFTWQDTSGATQWYVYWGTNQNTFNHIDTVDSMNDTLTGLRFGERYYFRIYSNLLGYVSRGICQSPSWQYYMPCPSLPSNVRLQTTSDSIIITWDDNSNASQWYVQYYGYNSYGSRCLMIDTIDTTVHVITRTKWRSAALRNESFYVYNNNYTYNEITRCIYSNRFPTSMPCPSLLPYNIESRITGNSAVITWSDSSNASQWYVRYYSCDSSGRCAWNLTTVNDTTCTLTGLLQGQHIIYQVYNDIFPYNEISSCLRDYTFYQPCSGTPECLDFTDFTACQVQARYGGYANPDANIGVVAGRHTVITTDDTDTNTNNQLHMIPSGFPASVRLGNANIGAQAESITYEYIIDTSLFNVLLLNYAAVMQDPGHIPSHQPRFRLQILDIDGRELDPECYSRDFVAGSNTDDWHEGKPGVLWKNWTTVGIDLDQLHGRTVFVKLTTFDCQEQAHFGYAYFTLECSNKLMRSTNCGYTVENTFSVPDGFNYRWYEESDPTTTLGTERSFHVTERGIYRCAMSMIGGDTTTDCGLVMTAIAGARFPYARFTTDTLETVNCQPGFVFRNSSVITTDPNHDTLLPQTCESYLWDFGDGTTSTEVNPRHYYNRNGTYRVMLVAYLSDGACSDTTYRDITVYSDCTQTDTVRAIVCPGNSYNWYGTAMTQPGTYMFDTTGWQRHILVLTNYVTATDTVRDTIVENQLPYRYNGYIFSAGVNDTTVILTSSHGCDSIVIYSLYVYPNVYTYFDTSVCANHLPVVWKGNTFRHADSVTTTLRGQHGVDSVLVYRLSLRDTSASYRYDTIVENQLPWSFLNMLCHGDTNDAHFTFVNTQGCDSVLHYNLYYWRNRFTRLDSTVCDNLLPVNWMGRRFQNADSIRIKLRGIHGEDSTVMLVLHVLPTSTSIVRDTIVENQLPWNFNGHSYTNNVSRVQVIINNIWQCDSTITYSLHVWHNYLERYDESICSNFLPYTWREHTFVGADSIATTYTAQHGEDSTIILVLAVRDTSATEIYDTIIQNHLPWYYNGTRFPSETTDYKFHRVNASGCDSIVHYSLHVWHNVRKSVALSICINDFPYEWNGVIFDTAGIQSVTLLTTHGADSVVVMTVRSKPTYRDSIFAETCNGTPYGYADRLYGTAGVYPVTLTAANECDSVVDIHLTVHPTYSDSILSIICDDSAFVHDGRTYSRADTYHRMYRTIHGCDSTLKIRLLVRPTYDEHVYLVFCQGSSVDYHDTTYTAAGQHLFNLSSMHGCDSVEHLYIFEEELPLPDITLEPEYATYERHNIRIHDNSMRAVERVWYIDGEYAGDDPVMYYNFPLNRDTIPVQLIVTGERGCQDSTVVNIPLRGHPIYAPNIFTPKRIENNRFCVSGDNLATAEVSIYTRRGALVCSFDGITECWDGTKNGVPCMQGSYTYLVRYTSKSDPSNPKVKTGTVTLIY